MTACPSRYLTADGRVLVCLLDHHRVHKGRFTHRNSCNTTVAVMSWPDDDPCVWDATCTTCDGYGIVPRASMAVMGDGSPVPKGNTCLTCGGTGVDEGIPLRLVGIGSVLEVVRETPYGLPVGSRVLVTSVVGDSFGTVLIRKNADQAIWCVMPEQIGVKWWLVRAVPPAHTTTN
jgi:hypothetical protein